MADATKEFAEQIAGLVARILDGRTANAPARPGPPVEYLTPDEAAGFVRSTRKALEHMRARGEGPRWLRVGGRIRYSLADLRRWMESGGAR